MHYPQLLIYESDGRLAESLRRLREQSPSRKWSLREPRGLESCLRLLGRGDPSALILKVGQDLVRELTVLERVTWYFPGTATIVVGDTENPVLADLAWDLGAGLVLFPPLPRSWLVDVVDGFLCQPTRTAPAAVSRSESNELIVPEAEE
jgi:hypothetical protein